MSEEGLIPQPYLHKDTLDDPELLINRDFGSDSGTVQKRKDPGAHYSFKLADGTLLDPYAIAQLYGMTSFPLMTVLKKVLVCGGRGYKDKKQDIRDMIRALERELELIDDETT